MKQRTNTSQSGFNLIELMIAIVIGLFISLMVVQYLATSSKLFRQQGADTNLEANGTFAVSYLSQFVRQAGVNDPTGSDVPFYIGDCGGVDPCTFNSDVAGESDQIAVQMFPYNDRDCANQPVPDDHRVANVFSIVDNQLFCRGYDVTDEAWLPGGEGEYLIDGIEQMQVLYGVSNDAGLVDRYVDASRVADPGSPETTQLEAWDSIRSVKLAVLVSDGANAGTETKEERKYQLLDSPEVTKDDRISRKVYSTTITINNKLP